MRKLNENASQFAHFVVALFPDKRIAFTAMSPAQLLDTVFDARTSPTYQTLLPWVIGSPRFRTFVETYHDKIRKKVRTAQVDEGLADLEAELAVAALLLRDRRLVVEYEKLGVGKQRTPDLTVTFKTHTQFHVEVTRPRISAQESNTELDPFLFKLASTLCTKLGQLPSSAANLVALVGNDSQVTTEMVAAAMQILHQRADQQDDGFFHRRGLDGARHFHRQQSRLSAILLCSLQTGAPHVAGLWLNPQAKHPLSPALQNLLRSLVCSPRLC
jgi:hypothetical protein